MSSTAIAISSKTNGRLRLGRLALALSLCAGCAAPFGRNGCATSCAVPVDEVDDGSPCCTSSACHGGACNRCISAGENCCCRIYRPIADCLEPIVCWPFKKICHLVNFCAPDGFCGPPDVPGPGRFHPVPTHPVFEPSASPPPSPTGMYPGAM